MAYADDRTEAIPVALPNGTTIQVEVTQTGREDVASLTFPFTKITAALEGIVDAIAETLQKVQPTKATVKFGMEVAVEPGQLTVLLVKGSGKGNLEITLEWSK